jgi:hypothetical protein
VTGDKLIAVLSQSVSGVNAINPLVAFYDIHGRKREVLFFYFVPDTTRDIKYRQKYKNIMSKIKRFKKKIVDWLADQPVANACITSKQ